jgi:hypothetical protein
MSLTWKRTFYLDEFQLASECVDMPQINRLIYFKMEAPFYLALPYLLDFSCKTRSGR